MEQRKTDWLLKLIDRTFWTYNKCLPTVKLPGSVLTKFFSCIWRDENLPDHLEHHRDLQTEVLQTAGPRQGLPRT